MDSNLRIHSISDCLKHLLMTSTNLHGKSFQQLLDPDDLAKFKKFMEASVPGTTEDLSMPPCLRVNLLGAANTRIPVELFHVRISKLYGSHDPYHLIALKAGRSFNHGSALKVSLQHPGKGLRAVLAKTAEILRELPADTTCMSAA